jgi:hypothetical protein
LAEELQAAGRGSVEVEVVVVVVVCRRDHCISGIETETENWRGGVTLAFVPSRQEQPLERAPANSVHLETKGGVDVCLFTSSSASNGEEAVGAGAPTSRFPRAGKVAPSAGIVVTVVIVVVLCPYILANAVLKVLDSRPTP